MTIPSRVQGLIKRARIAMDQVEDYDQGLVDGMVTAAAWAFYREGVAASLGVLAVDETGLGRADHLEELLRRRVLGTLGDMHLQRSVGVIEDDPTLGLTKIARPVGVVAVASPATAPCSSIATNAMATLKTRNAVVFTPNPRASNSALAAVKLLRHALTQIGAPGDLVQIVVGAGRSEVEQLMSEADLVVAAGGAGTVRRAYSSGTPAISAGVGNPVIVVDETANITEAARLIVLGGSYNNGTSCSSESNLLVHKSVVTQLRQALKEIGAHICTPTESAAVIAFLWDVDGRLRREAVGRTAAELAASTGIRIGEVELLVLDGGSVTEAKGPELGEKLSPVLTLYVYEEWDQAVSATQQILVYEGLGHSCGLYSRDPDRAIALSESVKTARVMVNQSTAVGNSGAFDNGMPFTATIASGTWGGCSVSENVTWRHFLNTTIISTPLPAVIPDAAMLFKAHVDRLDKEKA